MAIAQDSSTPSFSSTSGGTNLSTSRTNGLAFTQTSASFAPPAGSLVVVLATRGDNSRNPLSDNSGLTCKDSLNNVYTRAVDQPSYNGADDAYGASAVFRYYYSSAPGAITVAVTCDASHSPMSGVTVNIYPVVLTGCGSDQSAAATAKKLTTAASPSQTVSIVTTAAGSWVLLCGVNIGIGNPTALTTEVQTWTDACVNQSGAAKQTNATGAPGPTDLGWTSSSSYATLALLEILPAGGAPAQSAYAGQATADGSAPAAAGPVLYAAPAYATASSDLGGGSGTWAATAEADGAPDGTYATWTAP